MENDTRSFRRDIVGRIHAYCIFFGNQFLSLPPALMYRCKGQLLCGFGIAIFSSIMIAAFHSAYFAIGFLGALYMLWPIYSTTKDYFEKKIYKQDMICTLVKKINPIAGEGTFLYFRTLEPPIQHKIYYLQLSKKQRAEFNQGIVFSLYFHQDNPSEILAWDFVGVNDGTQSP